MGIFINYLYVTKVSNASESYKCSFLYTLLYKSFQTCSLFMFNCFIYASIKLKHYKRYTVSSVHEGVHKRYTVSSVLDGGHKRY